MASVLFDRPWTHTTSDSQIHQKFLNSYKKRHTDSIEGMVILTNLFSHNVCYVYMNSVRKSEWRVSRTSICTYNNFSYNPRMNILRNLLFSMKGKIGRADYIYAIVYVVLLFFVSADIFLSPTSIHLIWGGYDIGTFFQYIFSVVGLGFFIWSFFAVTIKRLRGIKQDIRYSILALVFPPLLIVWFLPDTEKYKYHSGLSIVDQIFFYFLIAILIVALFSLYRLSVSVRFILFLTVAVCAVLIYFFWKDRLPFRDLPRVKYSGLDVWLDLGFVLLIVFFIRSFILTPFQIIGPSMETTFHGGAITYTQAGQEYSDGEFIVVDKMSYRFSAPNRGDVVVFTPALWPEKRYLIKRVIGTPGDVVKIENWFVFLAKAESPSHFIKLDESDYLGQNNGHTCLSYTGEGCNNESQTFIVPEGKFFLMGDNRMQSLDARKCFSNSGCIGDFRLAQFVPLAQIQWRVAYSLGHFDAFSQFLPYPKLGTWQEVIPYRWLNIKNTHTYTELN